jgi:hypothetical protein
MDASPLVDWAKGLVACGSKVRQLGSEHLNGEVRNEEHNCGRRYCEARVPVALG